MFFLEGGQSIYIVMVCLGVSFCIMTPSQRGPFGRVFPFQKDPTSFFPALESFNLFFCIIFPSVVINLLNNDFCRYHTQLLFGSERMWNIYIMIYNRRWGIEKIPHLFVWGNYSRMFYQPSTEMLRFAGIKTATLRLAAALSWECWQNLGLVHGGHGRIV